MTQCIGLVLGCTDLLWVNRLNVQAGISDQAFVFSSEIISPIISQLGSLPQFVLAATLCPKGTEATLFALMMGVSNFGGTVGSYTGVLAMEALGGVEAPDFVNLNWLLLIQIGATVPFILCIPLFIPKGSPILGVEGIEGSAEADGRAE